MKIKNVLWIGALMVVALSVGGVAYASIPGPDGAIHGCYKTSNPAQGALIVVDSAASCPSGYTALNWNQTGPPGLSGVHIVTSPVFSDGSFHDVNCPAGETALSVSFDQPNAPGVLSITYVARPLITNGRPVGYSVAQSSSFAYTASVVCALSN